MYRMFHSCLLCAVIVLGMSEFSLSFAAEKSVVGKQPLEITAEESLEWHRNEQFFVARKKVRAAQGDTTLNSALLTAKYRDEEKGGMKIHTIIAEGGVEILSSVNKAYGDKATYDVDKGYAVMTGKNLKLVSPDQTVTAQDKMEYWSAEGKLQASGHAKAVREGDDIVADVLIAEFAQGAAGKRELKTLRAKGHVVITTPTEVLTGDEGVYEADTNIAEITGNVKVTRGQNVLEGEKAQVDLNTNISKMFGSNMDQNGSKTGSGRVRGVFYPGSEEKPVIAPIGQ